MYVGLGILDLELPHVHDLKAKRRVVRSLIDRLHTRYRISAAETGMQDRMQRAEIGVAVVTSSSSQAQQILDEVLRLADEEGEAVVLGWEPQILEEGE
jgi:uncharacterized protein YlxP (DUF503 family)